MGTIRYHIAQLNVGRLLAPVDSPETAAFVARHPELRERMNFDSPRAVDRPLLLRQLRRLSRGESVEVPIYRYDTHGRAPDGRPLGPVSHLVVEGLFGLYWKTVRDLMHLKIFLELDDRLCLERRIERDTAERGRTPSSVRRQYRATVRPMYERHVLPTRRHADLVLDGSRPLDELVREILARIP